MRRSFMAFMKRRIAQRLKRRAAGDGALSKSAAWRERASLARDFIDSWFWRRAHRGLVCEETTEEGRSFVIMGLFLRPINLIAVMIGSLALLSFIARAFLPQSPAPTLGPSISEWVGFAISAGLLLAFGGVNAWVFTMEHKAWMLLHPADILALRERRVITSASGKTTRRARPSKRSSRL